MFVGIAHGCREQASCRVGAHRNAEKGDRPHRYQRHGVVGPDLHCHIQGLAQLGWELEIPVPATHHPLSNLITKGSAFRGYWLTFPSQFDLTTGSVMEQEEEEEEREEEDERNNKKKNKGRKRRRRRRSRRRGGGGGQVASSSTS